MILLSSRFFGKNRQFRYHVSLILDDQTLLYRVYVDCVFKGSVKTIVSLDNLTYSSAITEFYDNILIFSGINIIKHGDDLI